MAEKKKIVLSYVMTTYNKLAFLKVTLPQLIAACQPDEEIVIADGGSSDGSRDYLQALYDEKKIHKFVSEKDAGEAHGTNKAILMAEGELVKTITDDDIFHYPSIAACRRFMLASPKVDILGFDGFGVNINHKGHTFSQVNYMKGFKKWKADQQPFLFCGLSYMMRRSSFAFMGLFNSGFKIVDIEYSIRVSAMKANIAFYTGLGFVNIVNPLSNSHKFYRAIDDEKKKLFRIYPNLESTVATRGLGLRTREFISQNILKRKPGAVPFDYEKIAAEGLALLESANKNKELSFL